MLRYGIDVTPVEDIREMRRALSSTSPLRLDYQGSIMTDYIPWKQDHQNAKDEKGYVFTGDLNKKKEYNVHDTIVTARCRRHMTTKEPEWKTPRVQRLYAHQRRLAEIAAQMNTTGIQVDKIQRYFMAWALKEEYREKSAKVIEAVGIDGWVPSANNMRALIWAKHGKEKPEFARFNLEDPFDPDFYVHPKEMTTIGVAEGQLTMLLIDPSTPKELKDIINLYWDAETIWKQRSTFIASKEISHAIDKQYRMHANWNSCGTDTGRFSGPLMVIPKPLRAIYVADPGCELVGADYKQMELRVMFAVTGDPALGAGIAAGNVYVEEAKEYFNLPTHFTKWEPKDGPFDPERHIKPKAYKITKNTRLAAQYGSGKKKFFQQLVGMDRNTQWDEAMVTREAFLKRNCRTVEWWEEETERVFACSYSESRIMHRRRVYPRPPDRPEIANYPIQSTAADVKNLAMIRIADAIEKYKMKSRIVIDLHDAIYTNTPKAEINDMCEIMTEAMEQVYEIQGKKYTFPIDLEHHYRWSDFG
jgi:DNA polymerase I-like protein with 3'-5' exonuclease and polymerase domains